MTDVRQLTLEYVIKPEQTFTYISLPFEVPPHTGRIDVAYTYDAAIGSDPTLTGGNTVDIGIIDPRGAQFMTPGFRGWSGSARQKFYIGLDSATPGYMPGPIQPGTWNICLGAYKVAANGCHCRVNITITPSMTPASSEFSTLLPVRETSPRPQNSDDWYKGELHCHTIHSDGDSTPEEVIQIARSLGLDFLAITDHNNRSHLNELARIETDLILIPGYEVTTYYGHWNIWGDGDWIDFRVQTPGDLRRAIDEAQHRGYLVSCNHPRLYGPDWAFPEVDGYSCVEIWNGPWELLNADSLAFWDARLKQGQKLVAVGGSDFHFSKQAHMADLAHPTVYIHCSNRPSPANLLRSLRDGHAFITESPTGPRLDLRAGDAMMGDSIDSTEGATCALTVRGGTGGEAQFCTAAGIVASVPVTEDPQTLVYRMPASTSQFIRAQLVDPVTKHCRAVTNPIYLSRHV